MERVDLEQNEGRRIVEKMLRITGLAPTQLARKARLSPSTLTRFLNNPDVKHTISLKSVKKLAVAAGLRLTVERAEDPDQSLLDAILDLSTEDRQSALAFCRFLQSQQVLDPPSPVRAQGGLR